MNKILIATYGSLRKGFHNHIAVESGTFKGNGKFKGIMQIRSNYPYMFHKNEIETNTEETEHEIEIYEIDKEKYESINKMELNAGYKEETISTEFGQAVIWITVPRIFNSKLPIDKKYTLDVYKKN